MGVLDRDCVWRGVTKLLFAFTQVACGNMSLAVVREQAIFKKANSARCCGEAIMTVFVEVAS